jgi:hypothetical protein
MNLNSTQTGQSTPFKSAARINQCDQIISGMRQELAKANAKVAEQKRINKPYMSHGLANQKIRNAGGQLAVYAASYARFRAQIIADSQLQTEI